MMRLITHMREATVVAIAACGFASGAFAASTTSVKGVPELPGLIDNGISMETMVGTKPDALLSVDMNRSAVVDRVMNAWKGEIGTATAVDIRAKLLSLRADELFAANMAGTFAGVLDVIVSSDNSRSMLVKRAVNKSKSLGDAAADLVYTPVTPCRLFDTRGFPSALGPGPGAFTQPNGRRSYTPSGACGLPTSGVKTIMVGFTTQNLTPSSGGYLALVGPGAPIASTVDVFNFNSEWSASNAAVPTGPSAQFDVFIAGANAHVIIDVVGYFAPPTGVIGDITEVIALPGGGLSGGSTSGSAGLALLPSYQLPQTCAVGQDVFWNGSSWGCASPITAVLTPGGGGLTGGVSSGAANLALLPSYKLPQSCASGQVASWNGSSWVCAGASPLPNCFIGQAVQQGPGGSFSCANIPATFASLDPTANVGEFPSMVIPNDDLPMIAYLGNNTLKVAKCSTPKCLTAQISTVDPATVVGQWTSIAVGADQLPIIAYFDVTNGNLKVAKCSNPACTSSTVTTLDGVAPAIVVGQTTSIVVPADGLPVISYFDATNADLRVAKCTVNNCTGTASISTVDAAGSVGAFTAIQIAQDGLPIIAYVDLGLGIIKVAKCTNAGCTGGSAQITQVDTNVGTSGAFTSMVQAPDGRPLIAYYDVNNQRLKLVKCGNTSCSGSNVVSVLDSVVGGNVGQWTSIAFGGDGSPIVSYSDVTNNRLKVVKCLSADCSNPGLITTVDGSFQVGAGTAIKTGSDLLPIIAYRDSTNLKLRVIKCTNVACLP